MMKPYGTTVFCDDIRDEVTGKKTYVGVYLQDMVIAGEFPLLIPQFAMAITYLEPLNSPIYPVSVKIFVPTPENESEVVADIQLPVERAENISNQDVDPLAQYRAHLLYFKISPFVIPSEGYVKVRAYLNDEEIRLGSLRIRRPKEGESIIFP